MKSLRNALINMRRMPYQTLMVILMFALTFYVSYTFSYVLYSANEILDYYETKIPVIAFFKVDAKNDEVERVAQEYQFKDYVSNIDVVTKQDALATYQKDKKDNPLLLELVTADILPASIEVTANKIKDLDRIKTDLEAIESIEDVNFQEDIAQQVNNLMKIIKISGLTVSSVLLANTFLTMIIIISLKVASKKRSISIMRIIGAGKSYIMTPYILEGMIYGILSSVLGWLATFSFVMYFNPQIQSYLKTSMTLPTALIKNITMPLDPNLYLYQFGVGSAVGVLIGILASFFAVSKVLRK